MSHLRIPIFVAFALAALLSLVARAADPAPAPLRIVLVGDSTVCDYPATRPDRGWGQFITERFQPGRVTVINLAAAGRSTKTFISEGRWTKALAEKPSYVFIQFGHNDSHASDKPESTDAATTYRDYLRRYIDEARAIGATPILVTPMVRRTFGPDGKLTDVLAPYADAMKSVAAEKKAALIDLHTTSAALVSHLGPARAQEFANKPTDVTHFNEKGARAMADLIIVALPAADPKLAGLLLSAPAANTQARSFSILAHGAIADGTSINTRAIQATIDQLAASGGGTAVIPSGVFISGALFFKPGVHLHLEKDAVLRASTDVAANFPPRRTRIEGHFEESFTPALINADHCDGLRITGEGTLDGAGLTIWEEFMAKRNAAPDKKNFKNLSIPRARLALIENSRDVVIDGITFKDSQFWNLHLYRCRDVLVKNARFTVPDDYKQAPSTDGIDVDSSQDVTIDGCTFSVTDDCIAMKGSKGPFAMDDKDSPPVERVRITHCIFKRGYGAVTLGSEATVVRNIIVENSRFLGVSHVLHLKLRPDTPQHYENIQVRGIALDNKTGSILEARPWSQYFDLKGQPAPRSIVSNITFSDIHGRFGSLGRLSGNPGQTDISDITFSDINVKLSRSQLSDGEGVRGLTLTNVIVNGQPVTSPAAQP